MGRIRRLVLGLTAAACVVVTSSACTSSGSHVPPPPTGPAHPHSVGVRPGAEGQTSEAAEPCPFASRAVVGKAFAAKAVTASAGHSPLGHPTCTFTVGPTNAGAPGFVTLTLTPNSPARAFAALRKSSAGARAVSGVGDQAFYVPGRSMLQFRKKSQMIGIVAVLRVPGSGPPKAAVVRADLVALARQVAAQL